MLYDKFILQIVTEYGLTDFEGEVIWDIHSNILQDDECSDEALEILFSLWQYPREFLGPLSNELGELLETIQAVHTLRPSRNLPNYGLIDYLSSHYQDTYTAIIRKTGKFSDYAQCSSCQAFGKYSSGNSDAIRWRSEIFCENGTLICKGCQISAGFLARLTL